MTAGLMCPPEMGPAAETITAITRPFANARSIGERAYAAPPAAMKIRAKTPTNSSDAAAEVVALQHGRNDRTRVGRTRRSDHEGAVVVVDRLAGDAERVGGEEPRDGAGDLGSGRSSGAAAPPASRPPTPRPRSALRTATSPSRVMSVSTQPGQIAFTWIRRGASSAANARTSPSSPAFDAQYAVYPATPMRDEDRRGDDDAPAVGEQRLGGARAPVGAVEVRLQDLVEAVAVARLVRAADAGVRDERVERLGERGEDRLAVADVDDARRRARDDVRDATRRGRAASAARPRRRAARAIASPIPVARAGDGDVLPFEAVHAGESTSAPRAATTVRRARRRRTSPPRPCRRASTAASTLCVS